MGLRYSQDAPYYYLFSYMWQKINILFELIIKKKILDKNGILILHRSKKTKDIFCLREISRSDTGLCLSNFAKSARAITAYLPFVDSFINLYFYAFFIYIRLK